VQGSFRLSRNTAEPEVPHSSLAQRGDGYGGRHDLDKVLITPVIEVPKETVAPIMLPADKIYRVYGRRLVGRIAMADSTVSAVDRKTQWLERFLIVVRSALGHVYFPLLEKRMSDFS
jgi:hypothetical protein